MTTYRMIWDQMMYIVAALPPANGQSATKVGDKVTLGVIRDGKRMDVPLTIGDKNTLAETPAE